MSENTPLTKAEEIFGKKLKKMTQLSYPLVVDVANRQMRTAAGHLLLSWKEVKPGLITPKVQAYFTTEIMPKELKPVTVPTTDMLTAILWEVDCAVDKRSGQHLHRVDVANKLLSVDGVERTYQRKAA